MKTHLVSFSTLQYRRSQKQLEESALTFGIDIVHSFTEKDLKKTTFYNENHAIFSQTRGFGYWLWKPYFILEMLKKLPKGDILMYSDSDVIILNSLIPLFDICNKQDIVLFQVHSRLNKIWTKRDTFISMNCDCTKFYEAEQVCGSPQLYKVNQYSIEFVESWLKYCSDSQVISDDPNILGHENIEGFIEHRHDQSILSLLSLKFEIQIHRDPSQWGNKYKDNYLNDNTYPQLMYLYNMDKRNVLQKIKNYISTLLKRKIPLLWKVNH